MGVAPLPPLVLRPHTGWGQLLWVPGGRLTSCPHPWGPQTKDAVYTLSAMTSGIRRNWIEALRKTVRPTSAPDVTKYVFGASNWDWRVIRVRCGRPWAVAAPLGLFPHLQDPWESFWWCWNSPQGDSVSLCQGWGAVPESVLGTWGLSPLEVTGMSLRGLIPGYQGENPGFHAPIGHTTSGPSHHGLLNLLITSPNANRALT